MAANPNRIAGTVFLSIDGTSYMLAGSFEYNPSSVTRESLVGQDRVHGFSEKPMAPHISGTLRDSAGLSVASLNAMDNVTVTAQLNNGKTVIGRNMWTVESQTAKAEDGTIEVKWEGPEVTEQ